jgi:hypothetical protein
VIYVVLSAYSFETPVLPISLMHVSNARGEEDLDLQCGKPK